METKKNITKIIIYILVVLCLISSSLLGYEKYKTHKLKNEINKLDETPKSYYKAIEKANEYLQMAPSSEDTMFMYMTIKHPELPLQAIHYGLQNINKSWEDIAYKYALELKKDGKTNDAIRELLETNGFYVDQIEYAMQKIGN